MEISLTLDNGLTAHTVLPVNRHWQSTYGKDKLHYCLPLPCDVFDLIDGDFYGTNNKRNHHKGAKNNENNNIHCDKSITPPKPKVTLPTLYQKTVYQNKINSLKHWQNRLYLEVDNIESLKPLFHERFINQKHGAELYLSLNMSLKASGGRPKGSKNKPKKVYKSKFAEKYTPKRIDLRELLKQERENAKLPWWQRTNADKLQLAS